MTPERCRYTYPGTGGPPWPCFQAPVDEDGWCPIHRLDARAEQGAAADIPT